MVTLRMNRKNPHSAIVGPTDQTGSLTVTGTQLIGEVDAARKMFPSDYEPISGFSGVIDVRPMSIEQIQSAIRAYELFSPVAQVQYPAGYLSQLTDAYAVLTRLAPRRLDVEVLDPESYPFPVRFTTESVSYPAAHPVLVG